MFLRIKRLYEAGRLDIKGLIASVRKKLITEEQFYLICGVFFEEATGNKAGEGVNAPNREVTENG